MLRARLQGASRAPDTCPGPPPSSTPQEYQGPSITKRIDRILSTSSCTNSLEVTELHCLVTDAITVLRDMKQLIAAPVPRLLSTKPTTTESLLSQVWDNIQQLKQAQHAPTSTGSSGRSWASIAAQPCAPQLRAQSTKPTARQMQELKIHFSEKSEQQTVLDNSNQDILVRINIHFLLAAKAVGIKGLPSGDLIIQTLYKEAKKALQDNQK
jgi:hypothetical protein